MAILNSANWKVYKCCIIGKKLLKWVLKIVDIFNYMNKHPKNKMKL